MQFGIGRAAFKLAEESIDDVEYLAGKRKIQGVRECLCYAVLHKEMQTLSAVKAVTAAADGDFWRLQAGTWNSFKDVTAIFVKEPGQTPVRLHPA